jgi:hypothetical protein
MYVDIYVTLLYNIYTDRFSTIRKIFQADNAFNIVDMEIIILL